MKISTMRRVDRWLGIPVCAALTLSRRLTLSSPRPDAPPPEKILFLKLAEQGSTVLAAPAFRRAIEMVGAENVFFLAFEENRFILDAMDLIPRENVFTIRTAGLARTILDALGVLRRIRAAKIDAVIDLEFFARSSAALALLTGARRRVGFHPFGGEGPFRGDLMTHRLRFNPHLHTAQTFRIMVDALEADPRRLPTFGIVPPACDEEPPPFRPDASEVEAVQAILDQHARPEGGPLILLNANCSDIMPLRKWPEERYRALAGRLLAAFPTARIAMTGAPSEAPGAEALVAQVDDERCVSLAGRTTLRQLLVLYTLADLLVTNDSGPAHFASLTPIDVITLFGPETPRLFGARTPRSHILYEGVACSPCVTAFNNRESPCTDNVCMQRLDVERVFDLASRLIRARNGEGGRPLPHGGWAHAARS
jgi:ADP-heptose:LPS heptosyltransferase